MKRITLGIRVVYCVAWLCGIGYIGSIGYSVIVPAAQVIVTTLHNATLDNRGLHE